MISSQAPIFHQALQAHYGIDKFAATVYPSSFHPALPSLANYEPMSQARTYIERHPEQAPRLGRTSAKGNNYLRFDRDTMTLRVLLGPRSHAALASINSNRLLRHRLSASFLLGDYAPPIASPLGNFIDPNHLNGLDWAQVPSMLQAEAAIAIEDLVRDYRQTVISIFGLVRLVWVRVSLTGIEIVWDIPTPDPEALIPTFARAVSANLLPRPARSLKPNSTPYSALPPIYMLVGLSPRFKLVIYPKLRAAPGRLGLARFEFRFRKKQIKTLLGTTVMPRAGKEIAGAIAQLAAHAWPTLVELDRDRTAPIMPVSQRDLLDAVGGLRNTRMVADVLDLLAADGKVRITNEKRRIVAKLEERGWLRPLLFRRPAYRKLAPGLDLSAWRRSSPEARAIDDAIANPIAGGSHGQVG